MSKIAQPQFLGLRVINNLPEETDVRWFSCDDQTMTFDLNADALYRHALKQYLTNLPVLDRRVLDGCYAEKKEARLLAMELDISQPHVERIVARARAFVAPLPATPPNSRSSVTVPLRKVVEK